MKNQKGYYSGSNSHLFSYVVMYMCLHVCMWVYHTCIEKQQTVRCTQTYVDITQSFSFSTRDELQHKAAGSWAKQFSLTEQ